MKLMAANPRSWPTPVSRRKTAPKAVGSTGYSSEKDLVGILPEGNVPASELGDLRECLVLLQNRQRLAEEVEAHVLDEFARGRRTTVV